MKSGGAISGIYSVLVEGDDTNEPVTDHMRAILDGHVMLSRELASRGHHPAIDVLHSTSRVMNQIAGYAANEIAREAKKHLAVYEASRDLIELGAHQRGANPALDAAVELKIELDKHVCQRHNEASSRADAMRNLAAVLHKEGAR